MLEPIKMAQFKKNCSGSAKIISISLGSKTQLVLFGKNMWWKVVNADEKSIITKIATAKIRRKILTAEINATFILNGRQSFIFFSLISIKVAIIVMVLSISAIRLILNKTLQSAKCSAPLFVKAKTPVPNGMYGRVK